MLSCALSARADIVTGLVGSWKLDGNAYDSSGQGNHGTITGATGAVDRFGKTNGALSFSGDANVYVNVPGSTSLDVDTKGTLSFWVNPNNSPSDNLYHRLAVIQWTSGYNWYFSKGFADGNAPNTFYWYENPSNNNIQVDSARLTANHWHYIVYIWDVSANFMRLYEDNVLLGSACASMVVSSKTMSFLKIGERWNGFIDDVRIYNRVLSAADMTELYNNGGPTTIRNAVIRNAVIR